MRTQHTVPRPDRADERSKLARWRRIVTEAAEQSGRALLPEVLPPQPFEQACVPPLPGELALILALHKGAIPLREALGQPADDTPTGVRLYVGPEGGFSAAEVREARGAGITPVSLGPRILRTETASLVALSAILYGFGELD
jgi:16S rRNA (uracil1498-N3)-methyltransferase